MLNSGLEAEMSAEVGSTRFKADVPIARYTWFQVGGPVRYLFLPRDCEDLLTFFRCGAYSLPHYIIGLGSNILIRDRGLDGVAIRLGKGFSACTCNSDGTIEAGAALPLSKLASFAQNEELSGFEFAACIPGSVGGALAMNAGALGSEMADVLVRAHIMREDGKVFSLTAVELNMGYRSCDVPGGSIFLGATLKGTPSSSQSIARRMEAANTHRSRAQPVRVRTGGSTFKNPPGQKAWQLIDRAGGRGMRQGGAFVSEHHCNFLINDGSAMASDLEELGEALRNRVRINSGIDLQWEIRRWGSI